MRTKLLSIVRNNNGGMRLGYAVQEVMKALNVYTQAGGVGSIAIVPQYYKFYNNRLFVCFIVAASMLHGKQVSCASWRDYRCDNGTENT